MNKKKVVGKKIEIDLIGLLDGKNPMEAFKAIADCVPEGVDVEDAVIDIQEWGYDGGCDYMLHIMRWETDAEFAKRKEKAEKAKAAKELKEQKKKERELKLLAKLKEKYG